MLWVYGRAQLRHVKHEKGARGAAREGTTLSHAMHMKAHFPCRCFVLLHTSLACLSELGL